MTLLLLAGTMILGVLTLCFVILNWQKEKKKNDVLNRRDKEQTGRIQEANIKLRSLSPNKLSFFAKMKHDFAIKEGLSRIAELSPDVICSTACLFHNGGHIPTQLSMIYEENHHRMKRDLGITARIQGFRTNKIYRQILALIDSPCLRLNEIDPKENIFCKALYESDTHRYLGFCIKLEDKSPIMFVGVHFTEQAELTEEIINKIQVQVDLIKPDILSLFAYKF